MENMFIKNIEPETRKDLIGLRENKSFAESLISQLQDAYEVNVEVSRNHNDEIRMTIEPHRYSKYSAAILTVKSEGIRIETPLSEMTAHNVLGNLDYDNLKYPNRPYGPPNIKKLESELTKLSEKYGYQTHVQEDSACGDRLWFHTIITASDPELDTKIKFLVKVFKTQGRKVKLGAL